MMDAAEKTCPICYDDLQDPTRLPCNHEFCQTCLQRSLDIRKHCPVCRKPVDGDYLSTTLPSQTRRARVRNRRTSYAMIPPSLGSAVGPFVSASLSNQMMAPLNQSGFLNQDSSFLYAPLIPTAPSLTPPTPVSTAPSLTPPTLLSTRPALTPSTLLSRRPALTPPTLLPTTPAFTPPLLSTAPALTPPTLPQFPSQSAPPGHLPIRRLFQNYTVPQVTAQGRPGFDVTENENEEIQNLLNEQAQAEQRGTPPNNSVGAFVCPYCQQGDMDELDLRDHCNTHHRHDPTPVVCPVCASLPHGDDNYYSRNFIGHLNLRHSYYSDDITDTHRSDSMNIQAAILESLRTQPALSTKF